MACGSCSSPYPPSIQQVKEQSDLADRHAAEGAKVRERRRGGLLRWWWWGGRLGSIGGVWGPASSHATDRARAALIAGNTCLLAPSPDSQVQHSVRAHGPEPPHNAPVLTSTLGPSMRLPFAPLPPPPAPPPS